MSRSHSQRLITISTAVIFADPADTPAGKFATTRNSPTMTPAPNPACACAHSGIGAAANAAHGRVHRVQLSVRRSALLGTRASRPVAKGAPVISGVRRSCRAAIGVSPSVA